MSDPESLNPAPAGRQPDVGRRRFWQGLLAGGLGTALASAGFSAFGHGGPYHGGFLRLHGRGGPEAMLERAEFASDWILTKVGASDAQKEQMRTIVGRTVNALAPLRQQHRAHRKAMLEVLAAPSVDTARLGELRRAELQLAGQASQALLDGVADAADVLSPEQRQQVVAMMRRHRGGRHEPSRGPAPGSDGQPPSRTS
ncbi:MAG: Spy/CpxP family protein refolding chaperone [Pseudomonadota bacterium]